MRSLIPITGSLITAPVQPAVTLDRARRHTRALTLTDDVLLESWIRASTSSFEEYTGRAVITQVREYWLDCFPGYPVSGFASNSRIEIPNPPLQSVTSVLYTASDGSQASFSDGASPDAPLYSVKAPQGPYAARGWIEPLSGQSWPLAQSTGGACQIQYVCGYGDTPDDVPDVVTAAICYLIAHFDRHRLPVADQSSGSLSEVPMTVRMLWDAFKFSAYPSGLPRAVVPLVTV
jgi:uncharacterized phiE125 gp8 family phage protein